MSIIAVDIGGTHTDGVLLTADGRLFVNKVKSTPTNLGAALLEAVDGLLELSGVDKKTITSVVHGTTVATNAVINQKFARVGLITTQGFADVIEIGTQRRHNLYDPWDPKPKGIVPKELRCEAIERVSAEGENVTPLDLNSVRAAAAKLRGKVDAIAVVYLYSFVNNEHEQITKKILAEELPGVPVSLSSEVSPEFREYQRTTTTVLNAALLPETGTYIDQLEQNLRAKGLDCPFLLMLSNGGVVPASVAKDNPVRLLVSGPAAGAVGAAHIGKQAEIQDIVMLDVGGTSADVALISNNEPQRRYSGEVERMPVNVPQIDLYPIGAGGGSIAFSDEFGGLRVGPESAGADPGPAAYGSSQLPTVTDAHLLLGILDPDKFLGGKIDLDIHGAENAIQTKVSDFIKLPVNEAAGAIIRIVNGRMASALRMVTVSRGFDIRDCALMAFGGAGPLHSCAIAEELGINTVIVPRYPGLTSAIGLITGDIRFDVSNTFVAKLDALNPNEVDDKIEQMNQEIAGFIREAQVDNTELQIDVDLRYEGQAYELTVPLNALSFAEANFDQLKRDFHDSHRQMYGHVWEDRAIELVTIRMKAIAPTVQPQWGEHGSATAVQTEQYRKIWNQNGTQEDYRILPRETVQVGDSGPLILEQSDSTVVIPTGWKVTQIIPECLILTHENTGE